MLRRAAAHRQRAENAVTISQSAIHRRDCGTAHAVNEDHAEDVAEVQARARGSRRAQILRKAKLPFVPPKPNEFDSTTSIFMGRAVFGT